MTLLGDGIRAHGPPPPPRLEALDRVIDRAPSAPDDLEYSAAIGPTLHPWRATYYFDLAGFRAVGSPGLADLRPLVDRMADALEVPALRDVMDAFVAAARGGASADQLVLGIDERAQADGSRAKIYLVVRSDQPTWLAAASSSLGLPQPAPALATRAFFIVGVDLGSTRDVKVYARMDRSELAERVGDLGPLQEVSFDSKAVVFRECLCSNRSQIIFQVMHPRSLSALLARRAAADDRFAELAERVTAMSRATEPTVWLPRLAAFGLRDGTLDLDGPSLYFHPSPAVPREPPHRLGSDPEAWEGSEDGRR